MDPFKINYDHVLKFNLLFQTVYSYHVTHVFEVRYHWKINIDNIYIGNHRVSSTELKRCHQYLIFFVYHLLLSLLFVPWSCGSQTSMCRWVIWRSLSKVMIPWLLQKIYFRMSDVELQILHFEKCFPSPKMILMLPNYWSGF